MKLYSIKDWNESFETHETRKLVRLQWVPIPNKHDGLGFRMIAAQKNSAELFGIWNLLVQIASKSERSQRGKLVRGGVPLNSASLETMTGFPANAFERAFAFFTQSAVGWLVVEDFQTDLPFGPGSSGESPGTPPDEWNGMEWKEGNGKKGIGRGAGAPPASLSLDSLKSDPTYAGINVEAVYGKMVNWCKANGKKPSMRRLVNWLNREDRPITAQYSQPAKEVPEPNGWKTYLNHTYPDSIYSDGQPQDAAEWSKLPRDVQQKLYNEIRKQIF